MEPLADDSQRPHHPLENYQFSPEEIKVLAECNSESFFQRSLPLSAGLGLATYFGVKNGFLQANIKYGAIPKVAVAVIIGHFAGKFSYQQKCAEKIMRLPNSKMGEILRQRRQGGVMGAMGDQNLSRAFTLAPFSPSSQADIYSDEGMQPTRSSSLNLDTESRPTMSGLDDTYRPSLDSPTTVLEPELPIEPAKPGTTYEDLRKKNREEFLKRQQNPYARPLPPEAPVIVRQNVAPKPSFATPEPSGSKNKYGDTWSD